MIRALVLSVLLLAASSACSFEPQDPPYVGCVPPCSATETCFRGVCVRSQPPPPPPDPCTLDGGRCTDAATQG